jgi:hypothetical protein
MGYPLIVGRFLGISFSSQLKGMVRPAFVTILLLMLASKLGDLLVTSKWFAVSGWIELILSVGVMLCVVFLLAFYGGLSRNQRIQIMQRVQMVIGIARD